MSDQIKTYVPGFKCDVFISYSESPYEPVHKFANELRTFLGAELGKQLFDGKSVFFDKDDLNRAPVDWKPYLEASATSAALFVPLLSPSYVYSKNCTEEWEWFYKSLAREKLSRTGETQTKDRVLPIIWHQMDEQEWDGIASAILGAEIQETISVDECGQKIAARLKLMRRSRKTVYVGQSESSLRTQICSELTRTGFYVIPDAPMDFLEEKKIRERLREAILAVHFVGGGTKDLPIKAITWSLKDCRGATVVCDVPGEELSGVEQISIEMLEDALRRDATGDRYMRPNGNVDDILAALKPWLAPPNTSLPSIGIACEPIDRSRVEAIIPEISKETPGFSITCLGLEPFDIKASERVLFYWGEGEGESLRRARTILRPKDGAYFLAPTRGRATGNGALDGLVFSQSGDQFIVADIQPFLEPAIAR